MVADAPTPGGMIEVIGRAVRPFVIVLGFLSSLVGTLGSFLVLEKVNARLKGLVDQKGAAAQEIDKLGGLASDYFMANQQGDLIYMLGLQPGARQDLAALIYKGNLLDRAEPVRNIMGALAVSRLLEYRSTYDQYEKLVDSAKAAASSFAAFMAVKMYEREVVEKAQARVDALQASLLPLGQQISAAEAQLRARQIFLIMFSSVGAFLLLLANLFEHTTRGRASGPDRPALEKSTTEKSPSSDHQTASRGESS
jgi:hypothetical protein